MGVPLQYILGVLLALATYSIAEPQNLRQIREAPPPSSPPRQNATEINNRDLNKIVKVDSKTEVLDLKPKSVNNVNSFEELPLKLGKSDEHATSTQKIKVEDDNVIKEKTREDGSRAIGTDNSKLWPSDVHNSKNVFTFPPTQTSKIHSSEILFDITRHPSFENSAELTTPKTKLFDQKFKETVESVKQKLDEVDLHSDEEDDQEGEEFGSDGELAVEDLLHKKPENNTSLEFVKTKTLVNNETVDKNSIHKNVNIEQAKKVNFEKVYNETKVYDDDKVSTTTVKPIGTTRKTSLFVKESVGETSTIQLLSNNIENEFNGRVKSATTTTPSTIFEEKLHDFVTSKSTTTTASSITIITTGTTPVSVIRANVSDEENVIPSQKGFEDTEKSRETTETTTSKLTEKLKGTTATVNNLELHGNNETTTKAAEESSTEATTTDTTTTMVIDTTLRIVTESSEETTTLDALSTTTSSFDDSTLFTPEEGTTVLVVESSTETSDATTTTTLATTLIPEQSSTMGTTPEESEESTAIHYREVSQTNNELDVTSLPSTKAIDDKINFIPDLESSTTKAGTITTPVLRGSEEAVTPSTLVNVEVGNGTTTEAATTKLASSTTEKHRQENLTTPLPTTTEHSDRYSPTTPSTVVQTKSTTVVPTTLLPSIDNEENTIRKLVLNNKTREGSSTSSRTEVTTINAGTTAEDGTETSSSVDSIVRDDEDGGSNKGKIAAIAISCVGAVCLVVLAGLLYVMKKRQRRLNYGPRCRPVSLDDYSIDNLSVYNSVRGKAAARMSKRSFGNPAFDDPVAPTHPLNFPALAKFSTNYDDIKAEFEDIPQITARTSELPEGCDTKNRYANIIPLPETRVFLKPIDGYPNSDYINANYVTGPGNIKGYYIATQGPMHNTVDDFWRMIWEQQVKLILMLTHLVENGLEKCVDYLPESEVRECSRVFGDFQITLKKREVKEKYIISSLQLKNMVSNSWREVTHFWYLGWPERGVPTEANSLIAFLIEARSYMKTVTIDKKTTFNDIQNGGAPNEHSPVVVHCSPGTGRTGVAIACDIAIREFETTRLVDIPKIVCRIRRDRANAIQTKEQYIFIYKVVNLYATKLTGGALENL